jgi:predicted metalloendopeptidase
LTADLRAIVEDAARASDKTAGSEPQKIGDFYDSFMNEQRVNEIGFKPLESEMAAVDRIATKADLARYFGRMFKLNLINPLIGFVDGDAQQPGYDILYVFQGGLGLPDRDYYLKPDAPLKAYREKYVAFLTKILTLSNQQAPDATAPKIFELETRLARSHWTNVESRDAVKTYNKRTLADLPKEFPGFDWAAWTGELGVSQAPAIVISQPSYVKAFAALVNERPVEQWKPYIRAALLNGFAPYLHKEMVDAEFGFYGQTLRGVKEIEPRWKRAVNTINANLGEMLGKLYVDRHFKPEAKARMERLVENLRLAFKDGIDKLEWMAPETKKEAQEKLAKFRPKIGYPNKWRDYGRVHIIKAFFNLEADDAVNYRGIGAVIGHEMGHGFDDQGRRYDGSGALRDWWTAKDAEEYMRRAKLLVEQYNEYEPLPGLHVNGELTLGENIGDLTGAVIAHRAYQLSLAGKPAPTLEDLSADQRYYLGWAQIWRAKEREDALRQQVMTNPHAPEMYRANGPLRNIPEFYSTFGLKESDKMFLAPERRTKIW